MSAMLDTSRFPRDNADDAKSELFGTELNAVDLLSAALGMSGTLSIKFASQEDTTAGKTQNGTESCVNVKLALTHSIIDVSFALLELSSMENRALKSITTMEEAHAQAAIKFQLLADAHANITTTICKDLVFNAQLAALGMEPIATVLLLATGAWVSLGLKVDNPAVLAWLAMSN